ncbi:MAG: hypothetical protein P4L39_10335 [Humidesulfovibrio sp.]|nr:hypothetical protein [Humidesulfovibrio sp.]
MYGLTDNIVAGPAGHTVAGPAGHIEAGPAGNIIIGLAGHTTPGPAGHTTPGPAGHTTPSPAGHTTPGPAGHTTPGPAGSTTPGPAGGTSPGPAGGATVGPAGGYSSEGGGHVIPAPGNHFPTDTTSARLPIGNSGAAFPSTGGLAMGSFPIASANLPVSPGGGGSVSGGGGGGGGGGGFVVGGVGGGGGGGGGGFVAGGAGGGGGAGATGGFSTGGGGGGATGGGGGGFVATGGGTGVSYMVYSGPGMPPVEVHGGLPTPIGTPGITVSYPGHITGGPSGHIRPPEASHFHGHASPNMSHSPVHVFNHTVTSQAWEGYHAAYVWPGPPKIDANLAPLPNGQVNAKAYNPPRVVFPDEAPGAKSTVDNTIGAARMQITQVVHESTSLNFAQPRTVENTARTTNESNVTLDNSQTSNIAISLPQNHESNVNLDYSRTIHADFSTNPQHTTQLNVEAPARVVNLFFIEGQGAQAALNMGGPIMASVA